MVLITRFVVSVGGSRVAAFSRHVPKFHINFIAYLCFYDAQSVWECLQKAKTGAVLVGALQPMPTLINSMAWQVDKTPLVPTAV